MKDFNEIFKAFEEGLATMDEQVNEKLSVLYDKLDEYRDAFKKRTGKDKKGDVIIVEEDKKEKKPKDKLVEIAPYMDEEDLHDLVVEFCDGGLETDMSEILPYLADDDVAYLAKKFKGGVKEFKGLSLEDLLPFADEGAIDELFLEKFSKGELDESLFSFVSDKCWHELVVKYCENEDSDMNIDEIYPFLDERDLKLLFKTYLKRRSKKSE